MKTTLNIIKCLVLVIKSKIIKLVKKSMNKYEDLGCCEIKNIK